LTANVYIVILNPEKSITGSTQKNTLIINHHIRVISEGSCDTEDWSNDAENHINYTYIHIENK